MNYQVVKSIEELEMLIEKVRAAQQISVQGLIPDTRLYLK